MNKKLIIGTAIIGAVVSAAAYKIKNIAGNVGYLFKGIKDIGISGSIIAPVVWIKPLVLIANNSDASAVVTKVTISVSSVSDTGSTSLIGTSSPIDVALPANKQSEVTPKFTIPALNLIGLGKKGLQVRTSFYVGSVPVTKTEYITKDQISASISQVKGVSNVIIDAVKNILKAS